MPTRTPLGHGIWSTYVQVSVTLEDLDGGGLAGIVDVPVKDGCFGDQTQGRLADPLPENDVLVQGGRLELLLLLEVENLEGSRLCAKSDDLLGPVHDGTVGLDGSPSDIVALLQVDNDDFGLGGLALLLSYADEVVGLECLREPKVSQW